VVGGSSCGIENILVPTDDDEFVGGGSGRSVNARTGGLEIVEGNIETIGAGGNIDVEGEDVEEIALPGNVFAVGGEF